MSRMFIPDESGPPTHTGRPGGGDLFSATAGRADGPLSVARLTPSEPLCVPSVYADGEQISGELPDPETIKALLTLATDGLAAEVIDGSEQEKAAVTLGRLLGRDRAQLVLTCRGDERTYDWPAEWQRAIADHARATGNGAEVTARREEPTGSGPPRRETAPGKAPSLPNAAARLQVLHQRNAGDGL